MRYPFDDIGSKLQRAEKHIKDFGIAVERFKKTNPYEIVRQPDPEPGKRIYDVKRADAVPPIIRATAGDVLQNLRTALDYIACGVVKANGGEPTADTYFPILKKAPTAEQLETAFNGKVKGASKDAINKIASLKPYQGGDDVLWRLHMLNKIDKHRLLMAAQSSMSRLNFDGPIRREPDGFPDVERTLSETFVPIPGGFPLKQGNQIVIELLPTQLDQNMQFFIEIAIYEPDIIEGRGLTKILLESLRAVWKIAGDFVPFLLKR